MTSSVTFLGHWKPKGCNHVSGTSYVNSYYLVVFLSNLSPMVNHLYICISDCFKQTMLWFLNITFMISPTSHKNFKFSPHTPLSYKVGNSLVQNRWTLCRNNNLKFYFCTMLTKKRNKHYNSKIKKFCKRKKKRSILTLLGSSSWHDKKK